MKRQQSGFTLIELIIVIVILGILAAFALPRFANLSGDARASSLKAVAGSMRAASAISHSAYLVANDRTVVTVKLEGVDVNLVNGYPAAAKGGMDVAAQITDSYTTSFAPAAAGKPGVMTVKANNAVDPVTCIVTYTEAAAVDTNPTFTNDPTGC